MKSGNQKRQNPGPAWQAGATEAQRVHCSWRGGRFKVVSWASAAACESGTHEGKDHAKTPRREVGFAGSGTLTQSGGGTNTISRALKVGYDATGSGTYDLSGNGKLNAPDEYIGYSGAGVFIQSGGTNTTGTLYLGYRVTANGAYDLRDSGYVDAGTEYIGYEGTATFTHSGGTNSASLVVLGLGGSGLAATYELSDTGRLVADSETIGRGTIRQRGGTNTTSDLALVYSSYGGCSGTYSLEDGTLNAIGEGVLRFLFHGVRRVRQWNLYAHRCGGDFRQFGRQRYREHRQSDGDVGGRGKRLGADGRARAGDDGAVDRGGDGVDDGETPGTEVPVGGVSNGEHRQAAGS
jgi:hypothetical protein